MEGDLCNELAKLSLVITRCIGASKCWLSRVAFLRLQVSKPKEVEEAQKIGQTDDKSLDDDEVLARVAAYQVRELLTAG